MRLPRSTYVSTSAALITALLLADSSSASAAWTARDAGTAASRAAVLPAAPVPTAVAATSTVKVDWAAMTFASGMPVNGYRITRTNTATGKSFASANGCSGLVSRNTCTETGVPDGRWTYGVVAVVGTNWVSAAGVSAAVLVSTTPGTVGVTFPSAGKNSDAAAWNGSGCPVPGFCGTATAAGGTTLVTVEVSVLQGTGASGRWWNPVTRAFDSTGEIRFPVTSGLERWSVAFPFTNFTAAGNYELNAYATDDARTVVKVNQKFGITRPGRTLLAVAPSPAVAAPEPTASATPAPTGTVAPTPTGTATPTPSGTVVPTPTVTATPAPAVTATSTPSPTIPGTASPGSSATPTPSPTASASGATPTPGTSAGQPLM